MTLLITGICGFVGSTLAREFARHNLASKIIGIDNFSRKGSETNRAPLEQLGIQVIHGDIRSQSDVDSLPPAKWVIDAAANPSVLAGVDGKTSSRQLVEHNLLGTINLLEYCKRHSAGFNLLSTSRVYSIKPLADLAMRVRNDAFEPDTARINVSGLSSRGIAEDFSTEPPISLYGCTKLASEQLALEYHYTFGFPVWINRCGVMAGAGQFGHPAQGIFAYWIHSFRERKPLKYIGFSGTGHQVRDCLHPRDLIPLLTKQFAATADNSIPRTINVSGGIESAYSLKNLTDWCSRRFGAQTVQATSESRPFDIPWVVLDPARAHTQWQWQPETTVEQILEEIAAFAETQPNWLSLSA
ncbi:MAG: NAD-dependent epimerase/dehydratase family protein [Pirellulales bacterium]